MRVVELVQRDPETDPPPVLHPVLVNGGTAILGRDGRWYSGMEEPMFRRPLQWTPEWWARIPGTHYMDPELPVLLSRIEAAKTSSCGCGAKTNNWIYHDRNCLYRILCEAEIHVKKIGEM